MVFVAVGKITTIESIGVYSGILSSVFALANLIGPLLGGAIADSGSWRWVFYLK